MPPTTPRHLVRHGLLVAAFCCAIAAIQVAYGRGPWHAQAVYSLSIGLSSWLLIEAGRFWLTRRSPIPWPLGWRGWALVAAGGTIGFQVGSAIGDAYCSAIGLTRPVSPSPGAPGPAVITTMLACLAISLFFYAQGKARYLEGRIAEAQRDAAEARLRLLQTQLEPHMMFNTLANLRMLIAADPLRAQAMLDHFIAYLRATLGASRATAHPLVDEFELLRDYLELMSVRMGARLAYTIDLPAPLRDVPVPPLLLQPLVENAIRHGLEPQVEGGRITVAARTLPGAPDRLELAVHDTGAGLGELPVQPGSRFGLAQVRERLATLRGPAAMLELGPGDGGHGTRVRIVLPLERSAVAASTTPFTGPPPCTPPAP
ncbi:histidine kinase [Paracidovorax citrulli]|uniref:sensor histidine kinase n=1 Tax=Paracidovorax citrulli TaxID=80869 RepID=UPI000880DD94|nr:histidine kinase [Paracidovorax citrulli]UMT88994.1 sensor histidine kinase [Paracidovorax citrulli]WIY36261.1 histidine kinase [Paracidovorax citrulli]SDK97920.1 Histidine kinase [Paracidovorax citrulli]